MDVALAEELPLLPLVLDRVPPSLEEALSQEGVPSCRNGGPPTAGRFVLFDSRLGPCAALAPGQTAIDVDRLRRPDDDPFEALADERSARHQWPIAGLTLSEEIARVDRRAVRHRMLGRLREAIQQAGGVWLCVSAFPFPCRSALNFRIDYDEFDPLEVEAILEATTGNEEATSHYLCGSACEGHGEAVRRRRGLDVGSHGYWHHTYRTEQENLRNLRRGIAVLQDQGIEPSGFVAPHGRFHRGLLAAMEQLGISHSSEFARAYDDLPFFPEGSRVLQIPVHPVCLELFLEAVEVPISSVVSAAIEHFQQVAQCKYRAGEAMFFYGHPGGRLGRHPQVLRAVFEAVKGFDAIWKTTFTRLAQWWRLRAAIRLTVVRQKDQFVVMSEGQPAEYPVGIEYWRGPQAARIPLDAGTLRFWPSALVYEDRAPAEYIRPVPMDRRESLRDRFRRAIDWEKATPVEEIAVDSWRNVAKRTLRRLRT